METSPIPEKPSKVTTAVNLLFLGLGIALIRTLVTWLPGGTAVGPKVLVLWLIFGPLFVWLYYLVGKGKNWARITVVVLLFVGVVESALSVTQSLTQIAISHRFGLADIAVDIVQMTLAVAAAVLLLHRESSAWFKTMKQPGHTIPEIAGSGTLPSESSGAWRHNVTEYKIKYAPSFLGVPKYGFIGKGTIGVDSGTVHLSGRRMHGLLLIAFLFPLASTLNRIAGIWLGVRLNILPVIVVCVAFLLILYYWKRSVFATSVSVEKGTVTDVGRSSKDVSFSLPDPRGIGGAPVKVFVRAKDEEEAMKLESELGAHNC